MLPKGGIYIIDYFIVNCRGVNLCDASREDDGWEA